MPVKPYDQLTPREKFFHHNGDSLPGRLDDHGYWNIYGEDANCDFGGPHHNPLLATFTGTLSDAIDAAVNMQGFWHWGAGGFIKKAEIVMSSKPRPRPVDIPHEARPKVYEERSIKMVELLQQRKVLEQMLKDLDEEIENENIRSSS